LRDLGPNPVRDVLADDGAMARPAPVPLREFDLQSLPADYAAWYASHRDLALSASSQLFALGRQPAPRVSAILRDHKAMNALARRNGPGYEVVMNAGLPAIVHFALNNLLQSQTYFPHIGDASAERPYRDLRNGIPDRLPRDATLAEAIVAITGMSRPTDVQRTKAAVAMTELAVSFCAYHEVAHIALGHVDANDALHGRTELLEVMNSRTAPGGRQALLRRVWEYEADLLAANMVLQDALSPQHDPSFLDGFRPQILESPLQRAQVMLASLLLFFLLVSQQGAGTERTHPDPLVRFSAISRKTVAALLDDHHAAVPSPRSVHSAVSDVVAQTLGVWSGLSLPSRHASPADQLTRARGSVQRLERHRLAHLDAHRDLAYLYPFVT